MCIFYRIKLYQYLTTYEYPILLTDIYNINKLTGEVHRGKA